MANKKPKTEPTLEPIKIWKFDECPGIYYECIKDHDDADWVAVIPKRYKDEYIGFLESTAFGCCHIETYDGPFESKIMVGHHS
jgi:hypothetical protein